MTKSHPNHDIKLNTAGHCIIITIDNTAISATYSINTFKNYLQNILPTSLKTLKGK